MTRSAAWIVAAAILALGLATEIDVGDTQSLRVAVGDLLAGLAFGWAGAAAIAHAPRRWAGRWLIAAAVLWFAATLAADAHPTLRDLGEQAGLAYRGALTTAVLLTCCRPRAPLTLVVAAAGWVDALVPAAGTSDATTFALAGLVVVAVALVPSPLPASRRWPPAAALAAALAGPALVTEVSSAADLGNRVLLGADAALGLTALGVFLAMAHAVRTEAGTADRILDLAAEADLDHALRFALADPYVRVLAADAEPRAAAGRERTVVHGTAGDALAVLEHGAGALAEPELRTGVTAAVSLQHEHRRRRRELTQAADEVRLSQRRMVVAADEARARLQRRLEQDAIPRALAISERLSSAPATAAAAEGMARAVEELRVLARGLHPPALGPSGLAGALAELSATAPMDVSVLVGAGRYREDVELVVYYVCAEALTNAIKHAQATHLSVAVTAAPGGLVAEVTDDGIGGAVPGAGSSMAVRAAAVDGRLTIVSPVGGGTTVRVEVPL